MAKISELSLQEKKDILDKVQWEGGIIGAFIEYGLSVEGTELEEPVRLLKESYQHVEEIIQRYEEEIVDLKDDDGLDDYDPDDEEYD